MAQKTPLWYHHINFSQLLGYDYSGSFGRFNVWVHVGENYVTLDGDVPLNDHAFMVKEVRGVTVEGEKLLIMTHTQDYTIAPDDVDAPSRLILDGFSEDTSWIALVDHG